MTATFWDTDALTSPMGLRHEYVAITGDLVVGSLLSQIIYWHRPTKAGRSKLRVFRDNFFWVAKSNHEWMQECGLTLHKVHRAKAALLALGLIETKLIKFAGRPVMAVRLVVDKVRALVEAFHALPAGPALNPSTVSFSDSPLSGNPTLDCQEIQQSLYTGITALNTSATTDCASAPAEQGGKEEKNQQGEIEGKELKEEKNKEEGKIGKWKEKFMKKMKKKEPELRTAAEILQARRDGVTKALYGFKGSKKTMFELWQSLGQELHNVVPRATLKELAQLKRFALDAGDNAHEAMEYNYRRWSYFVADVKVEKGIKSTPGKPQIDFLLQHREIAIKRYVQSIAHIQPLAVVEKPKPSYSETASQDTPVAEKAPEDVFTLTPDMLEAKLAAHAAKKQQPLK